MSKAPQLGRVGSPVQVGNALFKESSGKIQAKTADDSALAKMQCAAGTDPEDVARVSQLGSKVISAIDSSGFTQVRGHWDFDGDLNDDSGNAYHLTHNQSGKYVTLDGKQGVYSRQATGIDLAGGTGSAPLLELDAEVTIHCLVYMNEVRHTSSAYLFSYGGTGESEEANFLYSIEIQTFGYLRLLTERGSGTNNTNDIEVGIPVGRWVLVSLTRASNGLDYNLYFDGVLVDNPSASNAPTAGSGSSVKEIILSEAECFYGGLVISEEEQSAAEVLAVAQQVGVA